MFKKLLGFFLAALVVAPAVSDAQTFYSWRQRISSSCTTLTDGVTQDLCWDTTVNSLYKCQPTSGACDTAAEWKAIGGAWFDTGTAMYPLVVSRMIGIGTSTVTDMLTLNGNFKIGSNLIKGDSTNGLRFDVDGNGSSDFFITAGGLVTSSAGYNYTGSNQFLNVARATDKTSPSVGDLWFNTVSGRWFFYSGVVNKELGGSNIWADYFVSPTGSLNRLLFKAPSNLRIESVNCITDPGGSTSTTINIQSCNANGSACANIDSSSIVCGGTNGADDGSINSPTVSSGSWVNLNTTAVSGTPGVLYVTIKYATTS